MTAIRLRTGGFLETDDIPLSDPDETIRFVLRADVMLDPLEPDEAEADPVDFLPEIDDYLRHIFRRGKKAELPPIAFDESGVIGEKSYWVFSTAESWGTEMYVLVVRAEGITELYAADRNASFDEEGTVRDYLLSPAQAALLDYCAPDL